eukprot:759377-Rhodomonas_salina.1
MGERGQERGEQGRREGEDLGVGAGPADDLLLARARLGCDGEVVVVRCRLALASPRGPHHVSLAQLRPHPQRLDQVQLLYFSEVLDAAALGGYGKRRDAQPLQNNSAHRVREADAPLSVDSLPNGRHLNPALPNDFLAEVVRECGLTTSKECGKQHRASVQHHRVRFSMRCTQNSNAIVPLLPLSGERGPARKRGSLHPRAQLGWQSQGLSAGQREQQHPSAKLQHREESGVMPRLGSRLRLLWNFRIPGTNCTLPRVVVLFHGSTTAANSSTCRAAQHGFTAFTVSVALPQAEKRLRLPSCCTKELESDPQHAAIAHCYRRTAPDATRNKRLRPATAPTSFVVREDGQRSATGRAAREVTTTKYLSEGVCQPALLGARVTRGAVCRNAAYEEPVSVMDELVVLSRDVERLRRQVHVLERSMLQQNEALAEDKDQGVLKDPLRLSPALWSRLAFGMLQSLSKSDPPDFHAAVLHVCAESSKHVANAGDE